MVAHPVTLKSRLEQIADTLDARARAIGHGELQRFLFHQVAALRAAIEESINEKGKEEAAR